MFNDTSAVVINGGNFASIARDAYFGQLSGTNHFDVGGDLIFNLQIVNTGNAHPSPPHRRAATTRETEPHPRDPLCPTNAGTALQDAFSHVDDCLRAIGFVQTGSRNAISSPYLEIRQYELDDSTTNAEADEQSLSGYYLGHERVLEITIRIREPAAMEGNRCSGCGHVDDVLGAYKEGVRMKCACLTQSTRMSIPQTAEDVSRARADSGEGAIQGPWAMLGSIEVIDDTTTLDKWSDCNTSLSSSFLERTGTWSQPPSPRQVHVASSHQKHLDGQRHQHLFVPLPTMQRRSWVPEGKKRNLILVIGESGVGKSSFINDLAGKPLAAVNHGLVGSTTIDYYDIDMADGGESLKTFIDCPGYNHVHKTDSELNTVIRNFLVESPFLFPLDSNVIGIICLVDLSSPFRLRAEWHSIFTNPELKCPKLLAVTNSQMSTAPTYALSTLPVFESMVSKGAKIVPYAYQSRNYALPLLQSMFECDESASHFTLGAFLDKFLLNELWPVASLISNWEYYDNFILRRQLNG